MPVYVNLALALLVLALACSQPDEEFTPIRSTPSFSPAGPDDSVGAFCDGDFLENARREAEPVHRFRDELNRAKLPLECSWIPHPPYLAHATSNIQDPQVMRLLLDGGADPNEFQDTGDLDGTTLLYWLVDSFPATGKAAPYLPPRVRDWSIEDRIQNHMEMMEVLLEYGADPLLGHEGGHVPLELHLSILDPNPKVVELLLAYSPHMEKDGELAGNLMLGALITGADVEIIELLIRYGVSVETTPWEDPSTWLHSAAFLGVPDPAVYQIFIDAGVDVEALDEEGKTACDVAKEYEPLGGSTFLRRDADGNLPVPEEILSLLCR